MRYNVFGVNLKMRDKKMDRKRALQWAILALKHYVDTALTTEEKNEIQESILILSEEQEKKTLSRAVECPRCQSRNVFYSGDRYICMRCNNPFVIGKNEY
jgi:DNA-directed RNA polymerase subunit RPC12/RpoP